MSLLDQTPKRLYKFRAINQYTLKIFEECCLYFARPSSFNDPYDLFYRPIVDGVFRSSYHSNWNKSRTSVLCMSTQCHNLTLWSHYAENHKGICLEFAGEDGKLFEKEDYDKISDHRLVKYSKILPEVKMSSVNPLHGLSEYINAHFTKSIDWAYEEEYRFISQKDPFKAKFNAMNLKSVILGSECESRYLIEALIEKFNKVNGTKVELKQAWRSSSEYKLDIGSPCNK